MPKSESAWKISSPFPSLGLTLNMRTYNISPWRITDFSDYKSMKLCYVFVHIKIHFPNDYFDTFKHLWSRAIIYLCKLGQVYWLYRRAQFCLLYFVLFQWDVILFSAWRMSFDGTYLTAILVKLKEHISLNLWRILIASCVGA